MKERHRLLLGLTAAGLTGATLVAAGSIWLVHSAVRERFVDSARAETALLADWADGLDGAAAQDFAVRAAARLHARVTLIAADGTVLGDSAKDRASLSTMDNHIDRPEIRAARLAVTGTSFRRSTTTNEEYFYSARALEGDPAVEYVRIAVPTSGIGAAQSRYAWLVVAVVIVTILPLTALAYGAVRRLSRPLETMAGAVERAAGGAAHIDLPSYAGEELERLATSVRGLQRELLRKIAELDTERLLLDSVVSGMKQGLLLLGPARQVRLANRAARKIFDLDFDPVGKRLAEVVRHPTVIRAIDLAFEQQRELTHSPVRMDGSGRSFELRVTPLPAAEGTEVLVLLFDVSRLEALERVRRDFVANVSHELRTPLTSIRASVESLLEEQSDETVVRFLEIIRRNAGHMGELIEDLTDLSLIETGAVKLERSTLDLSSLVRELVERLAPVAREAGVEILVELPPRFVILADRRRLEQMLVNLIDNAIKFNRSGGHVRIGGRLAPSSAVLEIEDTGVGIPSDRLDKVFHRFYQVSQDRSAGRRGTGLGLAIVKHLMRLHGGSVRVESELGRGSTFVLTFPAPAADEFPREVGASQ